MLSPQAEQGSLPFYQDPNPALAPTILHPFSMTFLIHPFPPPSLHSQPQEESSPSSVFLRPSAPMMTSNSNSDKEWSAGRNSARQPISARTEKWDELAVNDGRTEWLHAPLCWPWEMDNATRYRHPRQRLQRKDPDCSDSHLNLESFWLSFSSVQEEVNQQCQFHAWFYWSL